MKTLTLLSAMGGLLAITGCAAAPTPEPGPAERRRTISTSQAPAAIGPLQGSAALQRALSLAQEAPAARGAEDTLAGIAGAYWFGVSTLIQEIVGLLPVERREGES